MNTGMSSSQQAISTLVDLPELIQTIGTQRRTGTLIVEQQGQTRRLYFNAGSLIAFHGAPMDIFARCLVWGQLIRPKVIEEILEQLGANATELVLIEALQAKGLADKNVLLDALDVYIEECMTEVVSWSGASLQFVANLTADQWAAFQVKLGVQIAAAGILLESMRRSDELKSMQAHIPHRWDVLHRDTNAPVLNLDEDQQRLMREWRDGAVVDDLMLTAGMSPYRLKMALARLAQKGLLKVGGAMEIVVQADTANSRQGYSKAYRLYLRAVELGMESPRIHLHIAELAEKLGDQARAAKFYVSAASMLADPGSSVIALRNALRLGATREGPLIQLYGIYQHLGEKDDAVAVLLELADLYAKKGAHDQASQSVHEAQELGADPAACAALLARIAIAEGDEDQAVVQLEQVARAAEDRGRIEDAVDALAQLCRIQPQRFEQAQKYAELLQQLGRTTEAIAEINRVLAFGDAVAEEILIGLYELKSKLDPTDSNSHRWLADAYRRRKNRDGATQQLKLLAAGQEREGDIPGLSVTLERILEVTGDQVDVLKRLALVYSRLGMDNKASATLARAVDAALAVGHLEDARSMCEVALDLDPASLPLRSRLAQIANRAGDREIAAFSFRAAADLARGLGKAELACQHLVQLRKLRPDDLMIRVELADLAMSLNDPNLDVILRDLVVFAVRRHDFGVALERARQRVQRSEGGNKLAARDELVELYRRMGEPNQELKAGNELLDDLLAQGEFDRAVGLLQRLVASNPRNADLVLQLAEILQSLGDARQAQRFFRHAVSLLQVDGRTDDAKAVLDQLSELGEEPAAIAMARDLLDKGQALEWEAVRWALEQDHRKRIEDELEASGKHASLS